MPCGAALWPAGPKFLRAGGPRGTLVRTTSPGAPRPLPAFAPLPAGHTLLGRRMTGAQGCAGSQKRAVLSLIHVCASPRPARPPAVRANRQRADLAPAAGARAQAACTRRTPPAGGRATGAPPGSRGPGPPRASRAAPRPPRPRSPARAGPDLQDHRLLQHGVPEPRPERMTSWAAAAHTCQAGQPPPTPPRCAAARWHASERSASSLL